jgi:predicted DNA binding protein
VERPSKADISAAARRNVAAAAPAVREATPDRFAVVQIRFEMPHDLPIYTFSHAHPDLTLVVIAAQATSDRRVVADAEIVGCDDRDYSAEIARLPGIDSVARIGDLGHRTRYQVVLREPPYIALANDLRTLLRYPRLIQNGEYTVEVAARVSQLRLLLDGLRRLSSSVEIRRFGRDPMHSCPPSLKPAQFALLQQALTAGYFDVPRRISLTRFAESMHRSKSTLSRSLALIERELAQASVAALV